MARETKSDQARHPDKLLPLTVQDHAWGCIIRGTRIQVIAAGLVPLERWPVFTKDRNTFKGTWEIAGKRREVMVERDCCPTDTEPGEVWVSYEDSERDCRPRVDEALQKLSALQQEILRIVEVVKPIPLSQILAIAGARAYMGSPESTSIAD